MADPSQTPRSSARLSPEKYARLREEARAPYRGLRMFMYLVFGLSGFVGGLVFLAQILAGRDVMGALPNFALQVGVVALMVWLAKVDRAIARKEREKATSER
ncbi:MULTISPECIES: DUF3493 domain-containing protein [unclassified Leptolyngbya]|uniref:DUF3493 domain-containing protein n=1 Tax=unclassified Leptolyngbya TaxID=2650499 RepID=UPI001687E033|nr:MULTISPECIES: DUF3493 domain-containing protein [unclassified Leptolyngbya]MBD1912509.1 DUF3493 domain-containing protein [Leptolyngbya sp. FACHB-8]MBD2156480.1 DUF3493 domain-containing protein [Leptolyngbya sp. FACHB-16]